MDTVFSGIKLISAPKTPVSLFQFSLDPVNYRICSDDIPFANNVIDTKPPRPRASLRLHPPFRSTTQRPLRSNIKLHTATFTQIAANLAKHGEVPAVRLRLSVKVYNRQPLRWARILHRKP